MNVNIKGMSDLNELKMLINVGSQFEECLDPAKPILGLFIIMERFLTISIWTNSLYLAHISYIGFILLVFHNGEYVFVVLFGCQLAKRCGCWRWLRQDQHPARLF